jgi:hypothetical protein
VESRTGPGGTVVRMHVRLSLCGPQGGSRGDRGAVLRCGGSRVKGSRAAVRGGSAGTARWRPAGHVLRAAGDRTGQLG